MHRIDTAGALPGGAFFDGDPTSGVEATVVDDDWLNAVQEELATVVETGGGLTLNKASHGQVLAAIRAMVAAAIPAGAVQAFARSSPPAGWLACSGQAVSRGTYATLFAAIGTTYGAGDGSTTFVLPDLRGEFLRGWDNGRGVDAGRALGSAQADMVKAHRHVMAIGEHLQTPFGGTTTPYNGIGSSDSNNERPYTNDGSDYDGLATNPAGTIGAENRPRNVAMLYCIRT